MVRRALTGGLIAGPTLRGQKTAPLFKDKLGHPQWVPQLCRTSQGHFWFTKLCRANRAYTGLVAKQNIDLRAGTTGSDSTTTRASKQHGAVRGMRCGAVRGGACGVVRCGALCAANSWIHRRIDRLIHTDSKQHGLIPSATTISASCSCPIDPMRHGVRHSFTTVSVRYFRPIGPKHLDVKVSILPLFVNIPVPSIPSDTV